METYCGIGVASRSTCMNPDAMSGTVCSNALRPWLPKLCTQDTDRTIKQNESELEENKNTVFISIVWCNIRATLCWNPQQNWTYSSRVTAILVMITTIKYKGNWIGTINGQYQQVLTHFAWSHYTSQHFYDKFDWSFIMFCDHICFFSGRIW